MVICDLVGGFEFWHFPKSQVATPFWGDLRFQHRSKPPAVSIANNPTERWKKSFQTRQFESIQHGSPFWKNCKPRAKNSLHFFSVARARARKSFMKTRSLQSIRTKWHRCTKFYLSCVQNQKPHHCLHFRMAPKESVISSGMVGHASLELGTFRSACHATHSHPLIPHPGGLRPVPCLTVLRRVGDGEGIVSLV